MSLSVCQNQAADVQDGEYSSWQSVRRLLPDRCCLLDKPLGHLCLQLSLHGAPCAGTCFLVLRKQATLLVVHAALQPGTSRCI